MQVYQIRLKIYMLQDVSLNLIQTKLAAFIDKGFATDEALLQFHEENKFKNYCFDLPYPIERKKVYKSGNIYTVTIRTIDEKLARYFYEVCVNNFTKEIKGLTAEIKIIPKKIIECLYTLTPVILKDDAGYWRTNMKREELEERLKVNLIKKWNDFEQEKLEENFPLYTMIEFLNDAPIGMQYKNVKLLGDKLRIQIADDEISQNMAYLALGTGLGEMNARGAGFVNYRWI